MNMITLTFIYVFIYSMKYPYIYSSYLCALDIYNYVYYIFINNL